MCELWDLLEGDWLFKAATAGPQDYDEELHLAYMTALLGPKPKHFPPGKRTALIYHPNGMWKASFRLQQVLTCGLGRLKGPEEIPGNFSFEGSITSMQGKDKAMFIEFVKRMIKWSPGERSTAKELLEDPWLYTSSED